MNIMKYVCFLVCCVNLPSVEQEESVIYLALKDRVA